MNGWTFSRRTQQWIYYRTGKPVVWVTVEAWDVAQETWDGYMRQTLK